MIKYLFALSISLAASPSQASEFINTKCYNTNITTPVVSVCQGTVAAQDAFQITLIDSHQLVYVSAPAAFVGTDEVFQTTKFRRDLTLVSENNAPLDEETSKQATIWQGYQAGSDILVYMQGSSEIDFLIDLRR